MLTKLLTLCAALALLAGGAGVWAHANGKADCCSPASACCAEAPAAKADTCCDLCPECCANCTADGCSWECIQCCLALGCDLSCCFPAAAKPVSKKSCCADGCCK